MSVARLTAFVLGVGLVTGCGDDAKPAVPDAPPDADLSNFPKNNCTEVTAAHCVYIKGGDVTALQTAANTIEDNTAIVLGSGTFAMTNQLTIRTMGAQIIGQGIDVTTLDYGSAAAQINGVDVISNNFLIQDLTVLDAPKDGIRVENSNIVTFRRIRATWTTASSPENGAYGIYPVKSQNVLVEDSRAENAADAGLYVGQCQRVIVRNNTVTGNVAGLEIENTQFADVYGNTAENNTGGIVVFDLPGNPVVGRDVRIRDNIIRNNNHVNFAAGGTVKTIPVGTGTFAMASRRVEITGNTYANNDTGDIALVSGLTVEATEANWALSTGDIVGDVTGLNLLPAEGQPGKVTNFRSENIVVANNTHSGSGTRPDPNTEVPQLGALLGLIYGGERVDNVLYDTRGEPMFDGTMEAGNSNVNNMCIGGNTGGTFASMALAQQESGFTPFYRPAAPFKPFQCTALAVPVAAVMLPQSP